MSQSEIYEALKESNALPRFPNKMSRWIIAVAERIMKEYNGKPENVWKYNRSPSEFIESLRAFKGIGQRASLEV